MAKIKYVGSSSSRSFTKADWSQVGVEGSAVTFDEKNNWTADVDDAVAEYLLANEAGTFVTDDSKKQHGSVAPDGADQPQQVVAGGASTPQTPVAGAPTTGTTRGT